MEAKVKICGGTVGTSPLPNVSDVSEEKGFDVCPTCGNPNIRFGSRDPCEGDYYWCNSCGEGPILFPLYYKRKFNAPIIDSEEANSAIALVGRLKT